MHSIYLDFGLYNHQDLSSNPADIAVTLNGIANIVTSDLARDISPELIAMLNHSRPHIRKRAVLALYKIIVKNPETIETARHRMEEKLDDPDPGSLLGYYLNISNEYIRRRLCNYQRPM